jgi:hypothetical protein
VDHVQGDEGVPIKIVEDRLYLPKGATTLPVGGGVEALAAILYSAENLTAGNYKTVVVAEDGRMWDTGSPSLARWESSEKWVLVATVPREPGDHGLVR